MDKQEIDSRLAAIRGQTTKSFVQLWENGPYWSECNLGAYVLRSAERVGRAESR